AAASEVDPENGTARVPLKAPTKGRVPFKAPTKGRVPLNLKAPTKRGGERQPGLHCVEREGRFFLPREDAHGYSGRRSQAAHHLLPVRSISQSARANCNDP